MKNKTNQLLPLIAILILLAIWIDFPNGPGLHLNIGSLKIDRSFDTHLGLDLVGGVQALLEADLPASAVIDPGAMNSARAIVESRVNGLGVSEASVQQAGDRRILVELPGEKDAQTALETIKKTGLLEFVDLTQLATDEALALENQTIQTDFGISASSAEPLSVTPSTELVSPTAAPGTSQTLTPTLPAKPAQIFHTVMTGADLKNIQVTTSQTGEYQVAFELSGDGAKIFSDFTTQHVGKILAIVLDKRIISAPRINTPITDGRGVITGNFTMQSANDLAIQLRYGSLPVPLKVATTQTVGPTLGQDSLRKSLVAGLIGLGAVGLFMGLYYRLPGIIADLALIVYSLFTLAFFKLIPVTLTLPGIAGFVLSIGMAVDANILIFERLKEELRAGRNLRPAIDLGWSRAWPSIRDSNLSTLITCFILFWFGSIFGASIVKGFSLTLALGVIISMFTAIVVTRNFLHLVLDNIKLNERPQWFGL
jgi:preprotein translocase subunit SecD